MLKRVDNNKSYDNKSYHLLLFLLQPFFTLLYYLKNFRKPHAKNVMWLFTIFYAATFAIGVENQGSDIVSYMDDIVELNKLQLDFKGAVEYFQASGEIDISRTLIAVTLSYFTGNGYYLIIVYGVIFGFFFSRNMWYVLNKLNGKTSTFTKILIFCLFLIVPIWDLNGFRFWTATHIFIYGFLPYILENKKKSLIWCFILPLLMHYSYIFALLPLGIFLIFGNRINAYFYLFILSFFISSIDISQFNNIIENYLPSAFADRSEGYRSIEKVEEFREGSNFENVWYAEWYRKVLNYVIIAFLTMVYFLIRSKKLIFSKSYLALFNFGLLYYSFAHILSTIPSGGRFMSLGHLISIIFIIFLMQNLSPGMRLLKLSKLATPFLIFFILISFRMSWYSLSFMTIFGNPITAIFSFGENISLNDIIKGF